MKKLYLGAKKKVAEKLKFLKDVVDSTLKKICPHDTLVVGQVTTSPDNQVLTIHNDCMGCGKAIYHYAPAHNQLSH